MATGGILYTMGTKGAEEAGFLKGNHLVKKEGEKFVHSHPRYNKNRTEIPHYRDTAHGNDTSN
jgi:hypothetical protein